MDVCTFVGKISVAIINPLLALFFAAGLLLFVWGIIEFLGGLSEDSEKKEDGKRHMLWGVIGMFIMVAALAIINLITNTFGLHNPPS